MRQTALRKNGGQALKDAMERYGGGAGIGMKALSARTRERGAAGVSHQLIGFLTLPGTNRHHRDTCSVESAYALEDALGVNRGDLFDIVEAPGRSDPQPSWDELGSAGNVGAK